MEHILMASGPLIGPGMLASNQTQEQSQEEKEVKEFLQ